MRLHLPVVALAVALAPVSAARAHLGGAMASVDADRAHMGAAMTSAPAGGHVRHTLDLGAEAGRVREYTNAAGQVFAVSWETAGRPDLRQLLGSRMFGTYQARMTTVGGGRGRRTAGGQGVFDDFVIQSSGHPGAFTGFAYAPALAPPGFTGADLK